MRAAVRLPGVAVAATDRARGLLALTAAALVLPGINDASAQNRGFNSPNAELSYNRAYYFETDDRVEITEDRLVLSAPVSERWRVGLLVHLTEVSGASPFAVRPNASGTGEELIFSPISADSADAVGSASGAANAAPGQDPALIRGQIDDTRTSIEGELRYFGDRYSIGGVVAFSQEFDYESRFFSLNFNYRLKGGRTTLFGQVGYSDDTVSEFIFRDNIEEDKDRLELLGGVSYILNRNSVVELSLSYIRATGFLSDQYKGVFLTDTETTLPEERPDDRDIFTLFTQYSTYLAGSRSALHVNYRYTADTWDTDSHAINAQLRKEIGDTWEIVPGIRYYSQSDATFYRPFFTSAQTGPGAAFSSDYRLAAFGALSPSIELTKAINLEDSPLKTLKVRAYYQRYIRRGDLAISDGLNTEVDDFDANSFGVSLESVF